MTFHWGERPDSRATTSQDPTYIGRYVAAGTKDSAYVKSYALSVTPPTVATVEGSLFRNDIQVNPSAEGPTVWDVDVFYGRINRQVGSYTIRWDISMGTERQYVSYETVAKYPSGAKDYEGLMGVDFDRIEGAEVPVVASQLVIEFRHPQGYFTPSFAYLIEQAVGTWNSTFFFGRAAGEVMLAGFRGAEGTDVETSIEYAFIVRRNLVNVTKGGITGINALGHDHLWFGYEDSIDTVANASVRVPVAAYVERVALSSNFPALLGFG